MAEKKARKESLLMRHDLGKARETVKAMLEKAKLNLNSRWICG